MILEDFNGVEEDVQVFRDELVDNFDDEIEGVF